MIFKKLDQVMLAFKTKYDIQFHLGSLCKTGIFEFEIFFFNLFLGG